VRAGAGAHHEEITMQRLSALDTEFLHLEDGIAHMHIAGMSVFSGTPPSESDVAALLASKLNRIPRYRQRIQPVPFEFGRPVWVDDADFNLGFHVRETALVEPTDEALCRLMGRLMSQELDRHRPLWELWIVHGLPDRRWALISKVHHCMVDGIAGVGLLEALLDTEPDVALTLPRPWTADPEPTGPDLVLDAWGGLASDVVGRVAAIPDLARHPGRTLRSLAETGSGLVRLTSRLGFTRQQSIEGSIGPHRVWAHSSATVDDIRRIRKTLGGTLNDVVLTAVTGGYRDLLLSRGDDLDQTVLRTLVPVSVRREGVDGDVDNRVSAILYDLPVQIDDPAVRLHAVRTKMTELKASHMADAGDAITSAANLLPPMVVGNASRLLMRYSRDHPQRSLDTVTTNVPGPQFPLYCLGRRMLEHRPYVPISHGIRVGTAILSYDGALSFGITGDFDHAPDVDIVASGIATTIDELVRRAESCVAGP